MGWFVRQSELTDLLALGAQVGEHFVLSVGGLHAVLERVVVINLCMEKIRKEAIVMMFNI